MPYLNRGASQLYYESHGQGKPLVLLHGVGGNHASWFHQVVAWRDQAHVITVDARGFGNSSDVEGWGRSAFVDDLLALLDALQLERVTLIAQSMGGGTACALAALAPQRVDALVLADTLVGLQLPEPLATQLHEVAAATEGLSQLQRVLGPSFSQAQPAQAYLYTALASFNATHVRNQRGVAPQTPLAQLARCGVPVLFLAGAEDVLFPAHLIAATASRVDGARYVEIPLAGHSAYFEAPHAFNTTVWAWLGEHARLQ